MTSPRDEVATSSAASGAVEDPDVPRRRQAEAVITALARRVARIELSGTPRRHHNNTLRGWGPIPVRVHHA